MKQRFGKIYYSCCLHTQAAVSILISGKLDFNAELRRRDKEGCFILLKGIMPGSNTVVIAVIDIEIGAYIHNAFLLNITKRMTP